MPLTVSVSLLYKCFLAKIFKSNSLLARLNQADSGTEKRKKKTKKLQFDYLIRDLVKGS